MKLRGEIATDVARLIHDCNLSAEQKARVFAGLADDIREQVIAQVSLRMRLAEMKADKAHGRSWAEALRESAPVAVDKARNRVVVSEACGDLVLVWEDDRTAVPADSLSTVTVQKNGYRQWYIAGPSRGGFAVLRSPENVIAS